MTHCFEKFKKQSLIFKKDRENGFTSTTPPLMKKSIETLFVITQTKINVSKNVNINT